MTPDANQLRTPRIPKLISNNKLSYSLSKEKKLIKIHTKSDEEEEVLQDSSEDSENIDIEKIFAQNNFN
jgi:hypothetical protein